MVGKNGDFFAVEFWEEEDTKIGYVTLLLKLSARTQISSFLEWFHRANLELHRNGLHRKSGKRCAGRQLTWDLTTIFALE